MKTKRTQALPSGIEILRYFYLLTVFLSSLHLSFFYKYTNILWFDHAIPESAANCIIFALILLPLLLYFGFKRPSLPFWYLAFLYHIFFTINSFLGAAFSLGHNLPLRPIIRIIGKDSGSAAFSNATSLRLFTVFNLNLFLGAIILWYLWRKRGYFRGERKE